MALHSTLSMATGSLHELWLHGRISHPHWLVFLLSGLAASNVSVISGRATQTALDWDARLVLDFRGALNEPSELDYSALAEKKPITPTTASPRLTRHSVSRRADGNLEVNVEGPDQIGFLGRFLGRLSLIMLFPIEIEINTVLGKIHDRVVLCSIGGTAPDESAKTSLERLLQGFTV